MDDDQVMHAMSLDDMYRVENVLARGLGGVTELVTIEGSGPFVRKKIPLAQANRSVWSACSDCGCRRLPHVEAMYELPDEFVVVYDFVPGDSVDRLVQDSGHLPWARAVSLAQDVCEAAGALHARGVIHRDISPTNVIVSGDGAHLVDLGIARLYEDGASRDDDSLGTWGYASPEQYGFAQTDPRSDIYSIGRLLAYMATGVPPADEAFDAALADADTVPPQLRQVIEKATAFEPSARYQSAGELSAALEGLASPAPAPDGRPAAVAAGDHGTTEEAPAGVTGHGSPWPRGRRVALACTGVAVAVGAALLAWGLSATAGSETATSQSGSPAQATASNGGERGGGMVDVKGVEWSVVPDGSLCYLVTVSNTSADLTAELPSVKLTGTDAQGNVTFSEDVYFAMVYPGQTTSMAGIVANGGSTRDVSSAVGPSGDSPKSVPQDQRTSLTVSRTSLTTDSYGQSKVTGIVSRGQDSGEGESGVRVDVAFRDAAGKLVGVSEAYPSMPAAGGSISFETFATPTSGKATTADVYANPWG